MSEIHDLFDELKDRYLAWRMRSLTHVDSAPLEDIPESPDIEFKMLDPLTSSDTLPLRSFANVRVHWLATLCSPDIYAQGQQCYLAKRVIRVHTHGSRMTGTTREKRFEDQEIIMRDGKLLAVCTCESASDLQVPEQGNTLPAQLPDAGRTLRCRHVVAIILAYIDTLTGPTSDSAENPSSAPKQAQTLEQEGLVCPVTRQKLGPEQAFYQCSRCGMCYSSEGWEFLRATDKSRCCGCESQKSIRQVNPSL